MWNTSMRIVALFSLLVGLLSCQAAKVSKEVPHVIASYPHDPLAFTQGLEFYQGKFYESTGLYGQSELREVSLEGNVIRQLRLSADYFAEGLTRVGNKLYQITWREGKAFVYDLTTFELEKSFSYSGEGWGICYDGEALFMSDGSSKLYQRNPESFAISKEIVVKLDTTPLDRLNELECVDNFIYANIWLTDKIIKIDKKTGRVVAEIDASQLLSPQERASLSRDAVLNGIAYNPESKHFFLTGKLWPKLFEVRFVEDKQ